MTASFPNLTPRRELDALDKRIYELERKLRVSQTNLRKQLDTSAVKFATSVVAEQTFGLATAVGTASIAARSDHTHGTPPDPIPAHVSGDPHTNYVTAVTGTSPVVSSGGRTPAISMPAATASVPGHMTAADKSKLDGIAAGAQPGTVTSVTGTSPVVSSGGTTPAISMPAATTTAPGHMVAADKSKLDAATAAATASTIVLRDAAATFNVAVGTLASHPVRRDDARLSDARTPTAHGTTHNPGGTDAITTAIAGSSAPGNAAAAGTATSVARSDHVHGREAFGNTAGTVAQGNDARFTDARTPTVHGSTHLTGGTDPIALATTTVDGLMPADDRSAMSLRTAFSNANTIVTRDATGATNLGGGTLITGSGQLWSGQTPSSGLYPRSVYGPNRTEWWLTATNGYSAGAAAAISGGGIGAGWTLTNERNKQTIAGGCEGSSFWDIGPYLRTPSTGFNKFTRHQALLEDAALGTTGWTAVNSTIARNANTGFHSTTNLQITSSGSATSTARSLTGTSGIAVTGNTNYSASARFLAVGSNARTARIDIIWYDSSGAAIITNGGIAVAITSSGWTLVTNSTTSPSNAAFAAIDLTIVQSPAVNGEISRATSMYFNTGTTTDFSMPGSPASGKNLRMGVVRDGAPGDAHQIIFGWSATGGLNAIITTKELLTERTLELRSGYASSHPEQATLILQSKSAITGQVNPRATFNSHLFLTGTNAGLVMHDRSGGELDQWTHYSFAGIMRFYSEATAKDCLTIDNLSSISGTFQGTTAVGLIGRTSGNRATFNWDGTFRCYVDSTLVKNFVIDHPTKKTHHLIHTTLEGPENAVFYRGEAQLKDGIAWIKLPAYFEALTHEEGRSVHLTPILNEPGRRMHRDEKGKESDLPLDENCVPNLGASRVRDGKFKVMQIGGMLCHDASFWWEVKAVRKDVPELSVEPRKSEVEVFGEGPYRYYKAKV